MSGAECERAWEHERADFEQAQSSIFNVPAGGGGEILTAPLHSYALTVMGLNENMSNKEQQWSKWVGVKGKH